MAEYNRMKDYVRGVESCAYELFGAHIRDGGVDFSVYAPNADNVMLCASHNNWQDIQMNRDDLGVWSVFVENIGEGVHYKYKVFSPDGEYTEKSDPFSYYNEIRPDFNSIVYDINDYYWRDSDWMNKRNKNYNNPLNIYEVHLGTWKVKDNKTGVDKFYHYKELVNELIPYVKEMGYTHIEFMPLTEYPFDGSWGYQVTGYYAATSRYGEPRYLMDLIDSCHINGIGVILDFVPVHFARDEHGLAYFDGRCLYESEITQIRESEWGSMRFDYSKPHVHSFVRSSINFWINKYHFDGIRFDAVAFLHFPDGNPHSPEYDCGVWFMKNTLFTLNAYHPDVMYIAEDSSCHAKDTAPVVYGGFGFDYMWNFGWSAETLRYLTTPFGMRAQNHNMMTYPMYYFNQGLFVLALSHDDVSNGKSSIMVKSYGRSQEEKFADLRTYYLFQMTHPGKKLNFMGNELAEYMEWKDEQPLGWNLLTYPNHDSFHEFVKRMNQLYKSEPALYVQDFNLSSFAWVDIQNAGNNIFAYRRDDFNGHPLFVVLNFSPLEKDYWLNVGYDGEFRELLSSDWDIYGGSNRHNDNLKSKDGYLNIKLSPLSGVIIQPWEEDDAELPPQEEKSDDKEEITQDNPEAQPANGDPDDKSSEQTAADDAPVSQ